jgi:hypothetical protein
MTAMTDKADADSAGGQAAAAAAPALRMAAAYPLRLTCC